MSRVLRASLGMGVSVLLAAGLLAQEPSPEPNLVVNGDFEVFEPTTTGGLPGAPGDWAGDATEIVDAIPVEGGVMPLAGAQMLRFIYTYRSPSAGIGSELWQIVDATAFRDSIDEGRATASVQAFFNRVHQDATTDTQFVLQAYAFSGSPATFSSQLSAGTDLTMVTTSVFTDADPASWEGANLEFVLPPNTDFIGLLVAAIENVSNNTSGVEFHGHYVDAVSLNVLVEPDNQGPSCQSADGAFVAVVGEGFSHSMQATDPDPDDTLAVSFDFTPPGSTWTPADGTVGASPLDVVFDWTPTSDDVGQWDLAANFTDGSGETASCAFSVTVDHRPEAEIVHERLPDANGLCHVALDGSGSFDADHDFEDLSFSWTISDADGAVVTEMDGATLDDVALPHGQYSCALVVMDPLSIAGEASIELLLEPEPEDDLADLDVRHAHVRWGRRGRIVMSGKVELPLGVDRGSLDPAMALGLTLADQEVCGGWLDGMRVYRNRWFFCRRGVDSGVSKLAMSWRDARYSLSPEGLPVLIRNGEPSDIGSTFRVHARHLRSAVTIDFDGRATVTLGPGRSHSAQGEVEIQSSRRGCLVEVQLPFEMAMDSEVTVSDGETSLTRRFGDDWTPCTGHFYALVRFDGSAFPDGPQTEPRVLDCGMLLGTDGPIAVETLELHLRGQRVWYLPDLEDALASR